jgi:hypothetical protein
MEGTAVQYSITGLQILAHAIMLFFLTAKKDYAIFFKKNPCIVGTYNLAPEIKNKPCAVLRRQSESLIYICVKLVGLVPSSSLYLEIYTYLIFFCLGECDVHICLVSFLFVQA